MTKIQNQHGEGEGKLFWNAPKLWQGSTAYIVGGGPSLLTTDLSPLHDKHVIGTNDAYKLGAWIDICYFGDFTWWHGYHRESLAKFHGIKVCCLTGADAAEYGAEIVAAGILPLRRAMVGLHKAPDIGWYGNTGASAINLAIILGAKRIVLVGFDMQLGKSGESNWHPNEKNPPNSKKYPVFMSQMDLLKTHLDLLEEQGQGVEVINATPGSAMTTFPIMTLAEAIEGKSVVQVPVPVKKQEKYSVGMISILVPTRQRPALAECMIDSAFETADDKSKLEIHLYVDSDDPEQIAYLKFAEKSNVYVTVGLPCLVSKAWNTLAAKCRGTILMMGNDDLMYTSEGWDTRLREEVAKYPDQIYCISFNDGQPNQLRADGTRPCRFPIISRCWYDALGYFVPEVFRFFYHDTWLEWLGREIGRLIFIDDMKVEHWHFSTGKMGRDVTTERNRGDKQSQKDGETFAQLELDRRRAAKRLLCCMQSKVFSYKANNDLRILLEGKRVALVGPATTLVGTQMGEYLDSFDLVCRINELAAFGLEEDYGRRCDILFHSFASHTMGNLFKSMDKNPFLANRGSLKFAVSCQLDHNDAGHDIQKNTRLFYNRNRTPMQQMSTAFWISIAEQMGCSPNTGMMAIHVLLQYPVKELFITGMSFYVEGNKPAQTHHSAYMQYGGDDTKLDKLRLHKTTAHKEHMYQLFRRHRHMKIDERLAEILGIKGNKRIVSLKYRKGSSVYEKDSRLASLVNGKDVVIVGPSPHLVGEGQGEALDKYDVVCRVNEVLPFGLEKDYGTRTDIMFHCGGELALQRLKEVHNKFPLQTEKIKLAVCPQGLAEEHKLRQDWLMAGIPIPFHAVGYNFWYDACLRIGADATTGMLSIILLMEQYKPKSLTITGFSFYVQGLQPRERHHAAYLTYGGDAVSAKATISNKKHSQLSLEKLYKQKYFLSQMQALYGKRKLKVDKYLKSILNNHVEHKTLPIVYVVYRGYYGKDFVKQSIASVLPWADKVFFFWTDKPFGDVSTVHYKSQDWQLHGDALVDTIHKMGIDDRFELVYDHWGTPDAQFSHLVNDRILPYFPKPGIVICMEPDMVWRGDQLEKALSEFMSCGKPCACTSQIELWKEKCYRIPQRNRPGAVFYDLEKMEGLPETQKNPLPLNASFPTQWLDAFVYNLGFCVSEEAMLMKHLCAIGFSAVVGDSEPNPDWFEKTWKTWDFEKNNSNLEISKGREHLIPAAVPYDVAELPEGLR